MSLGGLAIAIGMMVDGAIVMVENVDRMLKEAGPEEPRVHVVARACAEVARPVAFAVLIIIVVFLPLFTLQGVEGKTFRPLAYTVALAMLGIARVCDCAGPGTLAFLHALPTDAVQQRKARKGTLGQPTAGPDYGLVPAPSWPPLSGTGLGLSASLPGSL